MVVTAVCRLGALQLDAILLAVVALVCAIAVVAIVVVGCSRVGGRRRGVVVLVAVVGLRVVATRSGCPACAVEWCAAGLSPATGGDAAVIECQLCSHRLLKVVCWS